MTSKTTNITLIRPCLVYTPTHITHPSPELACPLFFLKWCRAQPSLLFNSKPFEQLNKQTCSSENYQLPKELCLQIAWSSSSWFTWYPLSSSSFRFINFSFCSEKLTNWSSAFLLTWLYFFSSSLHWCSFFHSWQHNKSNLLLIINNSTAKRDQHLFSPDIKKA